MIDGSGVVREKLGERHDLESERFLRLLRPRFVKSANLGLDFLDIKSESWPRVFSFLSGRTPGSGRGVARVTPSFYPAEQTARVSSFVSAAPRTTACDINAPEMSRSPAGHRAGPHGSARLSPREESAAIRTPIERNPRRACWYFGRRSLHLSRRGATCWSSRGGRLRQYICPLDIVRWASRVSRPRHSNR